MTTIHAIFEGGVFRPTQRVDLPERVEVEFEPRVVNASVQARQAMRELYHTLGTAHEAGNPDDSTRHDEHQP